MTLPAEAREGKDTASQMATKKRVLVDAHVRADIEAFASIYRWHTPEERAKRLESACNEFHEHCRDHRSLDRVSLTVEREYQDQCSACEAEWEPTTDETGTFCANCGAKL